MGDTEGEGDCEGASGRLVRIIGGGGPPGSGCDLAKFEGEWFDDRGGGGGGGGFDLGSAFLEELFYTRYPLSDCHVTSEALTSEAGRRRCSLGIDLWHY